MKQGFFVRANISQAIARVCAALGVKRVAQPLTVD